MSAGDAALPVSEQDPCFSCPTDPLTFGGHVWAAVVSMLTQRHMYRYEVRPRRRRDVKASKSSVQQVLQPVGRNNKSGSCGNLK